ncbi:response regulator [Alkalilimnicola ehrlichii]|uniref:response regulator n=1 Tax=Alkalilimnicola ehrlichii TaxID=351052 RepID=UPI003BA333B7
MQREGSHSEPVAVLVVDDEKYIVEEIVEYLSELGYDCESATSADEARKKFFERKDIKVVITDIKMPGEDGITFAGWLIDSFEADRVFEVAVLTGHGSHSNAIAALRSGVREYLQKPVNLDQLGRCVANLVERVNRRSEIRGGGELGVKLDSVATSVDTMATDLQEIKGRVLGQQGGQGRSREGVSGGLVDGFARLTKRQREVTELIAKGESNYQIANHLQISENTVKLYVSQVLALTGVSNRTQLALLANRHGLLQSADE